jgi:hypothetical protein
VSLAPTWELVALGILNAFYLLAGATNDAEFLTVVNTVGPVALMAILGSSAVKSVLFDRLNLWAALFWFRVATVVYFGFGALVPIYANEATIAYINVFYQVDSEQICATNLLISAGSLVTLLSARLVLSCNVDPPATMARSTSMLWIGILFAIVGFSVKFLIVVPYMLGQISGQIASGLVLNIGSFATVSLYLLTRHAVNEQPSLLPWLLLLLGFDMLVSILTYSKGSVLTSGIMFMLGYLSGNLTRKRIAVAMAAMFMMMTLLVPITDFGREESGRQFGSVYGGSLSDRFEILSRYFSGASSDLNENAIQGTLVRFSYTNAIAFAMNQHDSGFPGHTLDNLWALPIPRFLWPGKPNITAIGQDFNELALGSRTSGSSPGLFGDAYWNYGWWGLLILIVPLGIIYAGLSRYALWVQAGHRWVLFPIVMLSIRMGFRVDGYLIADIFGTLFIVLGGHFCMLILETLLMRMKLGGT